MPDFKWNEKVTDDLYELRVDEQRKLIFHRKSEFKQTHNNNEVTTKYGQYDWSDCTISRIEFSERTINTLNELKYKGVNEENKLVSSQKLSINDKNLGKINDLKYKVMEYICRFQPNNNPHILEYELYMERDDNFQKQLFAIIRCPVKKLTLRLKFHNNVFREHVCFEAETALGDEYSISSKKRLNGNSDPNTGEYQIYEITIKNPKMFCKYIISWEDNVE